MAAELGTSAHTQAAGSDLGGSNAAALHAAPSAPGARLQRWAQRAGVAGFVFFLVKGLLWLTLPGLLALWGLRER